MTPSHWMSATEIAQAYAAGSLTPVRLMTDLLARIGLDLRKVAVERNLEIVPRSTYAATALRAGDQLEIVHFIGGG